MSNTAFYTKTAATALRLIKAKGRELSTSRRGADAVFDPVTGTFSTPGTDLTGTLDAVVLPASEGQFDEKWREDFVRGKLRYVIAAASTATRAPQVGDTLTFDSYDWEVVGMSDLKPSEVTIIYEMIVKRK